MVHGQGSSTGNTKEEVWEKVVWKEEWSFIRVLFDGWFHCHCLDFFIFFYQARLRVFRPVNQLLLLSSHQVLWSCKGFARSQRTVSARTWVERCSNHRFVDFHITWPPHACPAQFSTEKEGCLVSCIASWLAEMSGMTLGHPHGMGGVAASRMEELKSN